MNYYFSGTGGSSDEFMRTFVTMMPYRLLSCHKAYVPFAHRWAQYTLQYSDPKETTLLLDSGAFTAWNQNQEVKLNHLLRVYYDFMKKYWTQFKEIYLINLDKIPGSPGRTADEQEVEECLEISDHNYDILVKWFGNRVLPVFHQGESEKRLKELCGMTNYLCVSPRNDLGEKWRIQWAREVHSKIPRDLMTHGLATTGIGMMSTMPWTSVDSATWIFITGTGGIFITLGTELYIIFISEKSPTRHEYWAHYRTLPVQHQEVIRDRIESGGYTIQQLETDFNYRMKFSVMEIRYWLDNYFVLDFHHTQGLFDL